MTTGVRDRSREILRAELAEAAADVCAEHGFDAVTADDLAHGIGISRATFFRYFGSKEDAIVTAARGERLSVPEHLRTQRAEPGELALAAVRRAVQPTVEAARIRPERLRARIQMIGSTPSLRARLASHRAEQRVALADVLEGMVADRTAALTVASAGTAAIELGWSLWIAEPGTDLGDQLDRAFDLLTDVGRLRLTDVPGAEDDRADPPVGVS